MGLVLAALGWSAQPALGAPGAQGEAQGGRRPTVRAEPDPRIQTYAYSFRHQTAEDALPLVRPLLSRRGTIELQPGGNTLVIRDTYAALGRIVPILRAYDSPPQLLDVEILIVRASNTPVLAPDPRKLPPWLDERLRSLLRWDYYTVLAESSVSTREGAEVTQELSGLYGLSFRLSSILGDDQIKLRELKIWHARGSGDDPLLAATLNLWLDKPKVLGLASTESSEQALMVVLTCRRQERSGGAGGRRPERSN